MLKRILWFVALCLSLLIIPTAVTLLRHSPELLNQAQAGGVIYGDGQQEAYDHQVRVLQILEGKNLEEENKLLKADLLYWQSRAEELRVEKAELEKTLKWTGFLLEVNSILLQDLKDVYLHKSKGSTPHFL